MPKETISEHGIVRTNNAANRIPKALLADEEFKKFRAQGAANERKVAKQIRHTTTEQKNSMESAFDSSQLNLIRISRQNCTDADYKDHERNHNKAGPDEQQGPAGPDVDRQY